MKNLFLLLLLACYFPVVATIQAPTIPTRLFDARPGNGVVDGGTTYPAAIVILFGTVEGRTPTQNKNVFLDAFAVANSYQATINGAPNPQSKQGFFLRVLTDYMKSEYRRGTVNVAADSAAKAAGEVVDRELPPTSAAAPSIIAPIAPRPVAPVRRR